MRKEKYYLSFGYALFCCYVLALLFDILASQGMNLVIMYNLHYFGMAGIILVCYIYLRQLIK
ncbi:MAG: hypothetical protein A2233_03775 [Candidatus Kerfeldbacteria bacterium RIFOXYA2_FULL_38_24]|uniref:Uncharacterized protein n=1 Tax=Candidatus Kerfeldbacteria bacterium RIFOXYB2_FULL_38_14 TaxID=1798547 RepID=A0A1G2BAB9_9BACT|nr:MAG: hypothetical protein A2233_03775 [Candidatus Kerfeldbacteria bacterium RIFOXYA2_FULL_38_24]OGY86101.1 MAG: hypothetical protein A2319_01420 [Candidatus Kerfeldbacteria bacterium RIFOXYB2_FULL_38_14]OGY89811.1 MAG: hypothetical protein A2458_05535 [Candidatus Kerfeldbacteria bacterium RIFOXYC2_FULL_38_9]